MESSLITGFVITIIAGLIMGLSPTPLKFITKFKYEHYGFISMLVALFILPWGITIIFCPKIFSILKEIDKGLIIRANLFSLSWGIAQVLALLCFIRIGVSLSYGILCAIGAFVGVITPMIFKATGIFSASPGILSKTGTIVLIGVVTAVLGVFLAALAGFKREKIQKIDAHNIYIGNKNTFLIGLIMIIIAGILSAGWGFAFAYSQGPIVKILATHSVGHLISNFAVWAIVLFGAAVINIVYPVYLITKNKSWNIIYSNGKEIILAVIYGLLFFMPSVLLGKGMLYLGALGASIGVGITQGSIIIGGQILGFSSGEWRDVKGKPRRLIFGSIAVLILSIIILAYANLQNEH